ncbi:MAG TPA: NADH:ubiquinone reductase (Na(+)-transporting) subunit C [Rhodopirellula baltica]|uniref:Na(+)-translocating NADH-quinone reductase subunit C n=3 Tax=Rhodopirellula baltica TaxID=265606 RepID=Q7UWS3_RHOBA|nr:Na(+)-translocating NADH-quinone reductase subunit C [Rhodopirellula baltica]EKK00566.1 Na(+)-translocating NADH-quinone reductase subunit C [Rhodopirellula baltica SH28]ELP33730.1 Na(+)-translocating NADH-quinone reductase subunit C [Rhodopirellula baltica SWK14]CAD72289.1 sodium-translocating NADH dehydrogenase (ubiquinone) subunit nqrC [Rhodopirellula baltica SH 1]HBE66179.1 NADH:ubiquinone reductase (Na(+)-transporting) subunit C [Rhodopirellula baltica]
MSQPDSTLKTIVTATILCVVCSFAVSAAAVALRPMQEENKVLDRQRNILDAAGLSMGEFGKPAAELDKEQIETLWAWVSPELVDLETGEVNTDFVGEEAEKYDPREAAKKKDDSIEITDPQFDIGVPRREKIARVYYVKKPGSEKVEMVVLPVYGKGLWSTLYGYMALKNDLETIAGLTFYEHAETPGLGGEVDNTKWKAQWVGNKLYDTDGNPAARVAKGPAPDGDEFAVDGLSGATITCRGVTNLVRYWAGPNGYGPFLDKVKQRLTGDASAEADQPESSVESGVEQYDIDNVGPKEPVGE